MRIRIATSISQRSLRAPKRIAFLVYEFTSNAVSRLITDCEDIYCVREIQRGTKLSLDITKTTQRQIFLSTVYEPHVTNYICRHLHNGDLFIDVGANVGYYTLIAAQLVGTNGRVIAYEPESRNFKLLKSNIELNNADNVTCLQKALAAKSGSAELNINPHNEGGHSLEQLPANATASRNGIGAAHNTQRVELVSLDESAGDVVLMHRNCLIKIDVEGYELEVLKGMNDILSCDTHPRIICEVSNRKEEIFNFLKQFGYEVRSLHGNNEVVSVLTDRRKRDYIFVNV